MYKPNASFNLSKSTKRIMSTILDKEKRNTFKQAMIQAELSEMYAPKPRTNNKGDNKGDNNGS